MRWSSVPIALAALVLVAPHAAASVEAEELVPPGGDPSATVVAVNEAGRAVGAGQSPSHRPAAVFWDEAAQPVYVGNSTALGVNARGDVLTLLVYKSAGALIYALGSYENGNRVDRTPQRPIAHSISARDINDSGAIPVGYHHLDDSGSGPTRAGVWRNGKFTDLPLPKATQVEHRVINDKGTTAGSLAPADGTGHYAFRCSATRCAKLAAPGPAGLYQVNALNESDVVAGSFLPYRSEARRAVVWTGDRVTVLPGDNADVADNPRAINESGDVVGWREDGGVRTPALWRGGQSVDLGAGRGEAVAVNDRGDVVGWHVTERGTVPFHWRAGTLTDLVPPGGGDAKAVGLTNSGVVVAADEEGGPPWHAYRWTIRP